MYLARWMWSLTMRDIWQSFVGRRHASIGIPGTDRNEPLWNDYCDEGSSWVFSRKESRPVHSVFIGGRKDWPSGTWALFGGEVGCRRLLRGAFARSGTARHQGHHR